MHAGFSSSWWLPEPPEPGTEPPEPVTEPPEPATEPPESSGAQFTFQTFSASEWIPLLPVCSGSDAHT